MGSAVHARTHRPQTRGRQTSLRSGATGGGGQTEHTRSSDTGGGGQTTLVRVNEGGRRPQQEHIFEFCQLVFSLRELPNRCAALQSLKFQLAPLIAPVPVALLYHVRTFHILCYKSSATHPSESINTFNELQKNGGEKKSRRIQKNNNNNIQTYKQTNKQTNKPTNKQEHTIYIISLVR